MNGNIKTWALTVSLSLTFGLLMAFWGLGKNSENRFISFLLYTVFFAIIHRAMMSKWRK